MVTAAVPLVEVIVVMEDGTDTGGLSGMSSVGLKPQSRQIEDTQRFMSSSDSATRYQVLSSVLRSNTKLFSSSFFVNDRPASTCSHRFRLMVLIGRRDCWFL